MKKSPPPPAPKITFPPFDIDDVESIRAKLKSNQSDTPQLPPLDTGALWFVRLPGMTQLACVQIDEITEHTVVFHLQPELDRRSHAIIRYARADVIFIERLPGLTEEKSNTLVEPTKCCADWEANIPKVNGPIFLQTLRNGKGYDGKPFTFCPWCGSQLK